MKREQDSEVRTAASGQDNRVRRVFGFPDFWPVLEAKYPRFFEVAPKALTPMHSITDRA
jgi:hypothetical protein